jgi:hypothetical protein
MKTGALYGFLLARLGGCGGSAQVPPRFPPVAFYRLDQRAGSNSVVVSTGRRHPIYYERSVLTAGNPEQYLREMGWIRSEVRGAYRMLVGRLAEEGLLTPDEANSLRPRLSVKVTDGRDDRSVPLPPSQQGAP